MKYPELKKAYYERNGVKVDLVKPEIYEENGYLIISAILKEEATDSKFKELEELFGFKVGNHSQYFEELGSIKKDAHCENCYNHTIIPFVSLDNLTNNYSELTARFRSNYRIEDYYKLNRFDETRKGKFLSSFTVQGFKARFDKLTTIYKERIVNSKKEKYPIEFRKDFTEAILNFQYNGTFYKLELSIVDTNEDDLTIFSILNNCIITEELFSEIKPKLIDFLSFMCGNRLAIRKEHFITEKGGISYLYSTEKITSTNYSNFFPISVGEFAKDRIIQNYFDCFNRFLEISDKLSLGHVIAMINETNKLYIDTSYFILLIAMEKLSFNFINSDLYKGHLQYEIRVEDFKKRIKKVKEVFKKEFNDIPDKNSRNNLFSKLGSINQKTKSNFKIDALLDFSEIEVDAEINDIFPVLRNLAIHEGKIDYPSGKEAKDNYHILDKLVRSIIANLIFYKGLRYYEIKGNVIQVGQKKEYKNKNSLNTKYLR